jgi:hypothetical protein
MDLSLQIELMIISSLKTSIRGDERKKEEGRGKK